MGAAPGKVHEGGVYPLGVRLLARSLRADLTIPAIAIEEPGLALITHTEVEDLPQPFFGPRCGHRRHDFHPPGEIAEHPVGRPYVKFALKGIVVASGEMEDPRVLEEASNDRTHANTLAAAGDAGPEAADPPDHQVNRYARASRVTERLSV
jgi:hypothetical protein